MGNERDRWAGSGLSVGGTMTDDEMDVGTPSADLSSGTLLGQYQLIRPIGHGGMGAVYLARDIRLGRRVAIKLMAHSGSSRADRFMAEARVTARCKHENIVDIYDIGMAQGHSFMVLEHIEGVTLQTWLRERWQPHATVAWANEKGVDGAARPAVPSAMPPAMPPAMIDQPVPPALAVEMIVPIVRALAHAHSLGLVHRDLKPANIMLTDDGLIKMLDFGIAKVLAHSSEGSEEDHAQRATGDEPDEFWAERDFQTRAGAIIGTLPYMSPEQRNGGVIDPRTDIWAVGIILWELCTGRHPLAPMTPERLATVGDLRKVMPSLVEMRPQLGALAGIVDRCLCKDIAERTPSAQALLEQLEPLLPTRGRDRTASKDELANPYVGLAAFQKADAGRFFGRARDVAAVTNLLRNHHLVTVAGASGAGKSSFIRAGVLPALERSGHNWETFIVRPGRQPLFALSEVLTQLYSGSVEADGTADGPDADPSLVASLRTQPGHLGVRLRSRCHDRRTRVLLFVDQFEELYTHGSSRETRETFARCLEGVADDASSPLRVILAVRSDFLDRVAEDRALSTQLVRGMMLMAPLAREQLRQALVEPLAAVGYAFESDALVESMLDSLAATRSPLPLLQFAAARLWDARDRQRRCISEESYRALGGVEGALATHADAVLTALTASDQRLARDIFTRVVSEDRTRAIVSVAELRANARSPGTGSASADDGADASADDEADDALGRVVRHLVEARLLLMETDDEGESTVELIHESLIERWPKLVRWLDEDQDVAQFRVRLAAAARQWDRQGRIDGLLWRGDAARDAERWLARHPDRLTDRLTGLGARDRAFLEALVALAARGRRRRNLAVFGTMALLGIIAAVVAVLALRAESEAVQARENAARARENAARARENAARASASAAEAEMRTAQARNASRMASAREHLADATLALALVREMEPAGELPPRWQELARAALYQGVAQEVFVHVGAVNSAAFSPDGTRVATACGDQSARVWTVDGSSEPVVLSGHAGVVHGVAFSPDGKRVATASADKTARVWNADGSGRPVVLTGHRDVVYGVAFGPRGARIITASFDQTARVWNADGSGRPIVLEGHKDRVYGASFSPDGGRVVTASADDTARVWRADGSGEPVALKGHTIIVYTAVFSPDGTRVLTAAADQTARVWNADGSGEPVILRGHQSDVFSARFNADGTRIVTASRDGTARLWNADDGGRYIEITGHREAVLWAAFAPDGTRVVTASGDRTARVWRADGVGRPIELRGHQNRIYSAVFSPNGKRIVTASKDRTARVWSADGSGEPAVLRWDREYPYTAVFSPDGTKIATASTDKKARVWNADGSGRPVELPGKGVSGHRSVLLSAAFSPDGKRIVTASFDDDARVWNADGTGESIVLSGHEGRLQSAAFSPDGQRIVTASWDHTARVWNADGTGRPIVLRGHEDHVTTAAFSPDGARIVTASRDHTVRVWNADGSGAPMVLEGHEAFALAGVRGGQGAFSRDGGRIVSMSKDNTVRVWPADGAREPLILRLADVDPQSAAFSPDGTSIVTASHQKRDPTTGEIAYWATVWPGVAPFTGLSDPALWTASSYCPPVATRMELLGVTEEFATRRLRACRARVAAARSGE